MLAAVAMLFALQGNRPPLPPAATFVRPRSPELIARDSLEAAELRFFYEWGDAYSLSRDYGAKFGAWPLQMALSECTMFQDRKPGATRIVAWKGRIVSSRSSYSVCPTWPLADSVFLDESKQLDLALDVRFRDAVRRGRESLIAAFALANAKFPQNSWIVGQLIRLLTDQRDLDRAVVVARQCRANEAWCHELLGFALVQISAFAGADTAFAAAMSAMPESDRCRWSDVGVLLDSAARAEYSAIPCAARDSINAKLWWLADPLWSAPGNERRAVQYARNVAVALRTAVPRDERWSWQPQLGGDALQEMLLRYGWPSLTYWAGLNHDRARTGRYLVARERGAVNPPYTTYEYSTGRLQTFPAWAAVAHPLAARSSDWTLGSPEPIRIVGEPRDTLGGRGNDVTSEDVVSRTAQWWWPPNHFAPHVPIRQLPDDEHVFLRRQDGAVFATVMEPTTEQLGRATGDSVDATLILTTQPDSLRAVSSARLAAGSPLVLFGNIDAGPALLGIELAADASSGAPAARTRYGIAPPPPLSAMRADERAISDLVLLRAPANGDALPLDPDGVLPSMRSSTVPMHTPQFGVYWETYGIAPVDTVTIAVWVERYTPQGMLRKLGISLSVARDLNTPIATNWTAVGSGGNAYVIGGPVPVVGRSIVLDASALQPGAYWLDVIVRPRGGEPLQARRTFTVLP